MQLEINILTIFYGVVSLQGYIVSLALFFVKRGNRSANRILGLLTLLLSYYLTDYFFGQIKLFHEFPHLLHVSTPLWYLFAPLSYFYVRALLYPESRLKLTHLLHTLPFLFIAYRFRQFYFLPGDVKLLYWTGELLPPEGNFFNYLVALINPFQGILYTSYLIKVIIKAGKSIHLLRINKAQITWLKFLFTLLLVYYLSSYTFNLLYFSNNLFYDFLIHIHLAVFAFITYGIAFLAVSNPEKFFPVDILPIIKKPNISFTPDQIQSYSSELKSLMLTKKLYLNPELKYSDVATELGISVRQFSALLNKYIGTSFNDFVNDYRIKEVINQLERKSYDNLTLLAIAHNAGFSSKASFNRIFKKHTGITPSEYITDLELNHISEIVNPQ